MSRIPMVDPASLDGELGRYRDEQPDGKLDVFSLIATAPTCAMPYLTFMKATFGQLELTNAERELAVLAVSHLESAQYEWLQHVEVARMIGIADIKVAAIGAGFAAQGPFSDKEWALLEFVRAVVREVRVNDATYAAMARHFPPRQIVETITLVGGYMTLGRLTEVAEMREDKILGPEVFRAAQVVR